MDKRCGTCSHTEHEPGRCPYDNCGQSEISALTSERQTTAEIPQFNDLCSSLVIRRYDKGHLVPKRRAE
jgi:hypothetical protein